MATMSGICGRTPLTFFNGNLYMSASVNRLGWASAWVIQAGLALSLAEPLVCFSNPDSTLIRPMLKLDPSRAWAEPDPRPKDKQNFHKCNPVLTFQKIRINA